MTQGDYTCLALLVLAVPLLPVYPSIICHSIQIHSFSIHCSEEYLCPNPRRQKRLKQLDSLNESMDLMHYGLCGLLVGESQELGHLDSVLEPLKMDPVSVWLTQRTLA